MKEIKKYNINNLLLKPKQGLLVNTQLKHFNQT